MTIPRRQFLRTGSDFAGLAAAVMLFEEQARAQGTAMAEVGEGGVLKSLHHPPKAKRVIQLFMAGAIT